MPKMTEILAEQLSANLSDTLKNPELSKHGRGLEHDNFMESKRYVCFYQDGDSLSRCVDIESLLQGTTSEGGSNNEGNSNEDNGVKGVVEHHWDQKVFGYPYFVLQVFFGDNVVVKDGTNKTITLKKTPNKQYHLTVAVDHFPLVDSVDPENKIGTVQDTIAVTWLVDTVEETMSFYSVQTDIPVIRDFLKATNIEKQVNLTDFFKNIQLSEQAQEVIRRRALERGFLLKDKNKANKKGDFADTIERNLGVTEQQKITFFIDSEQVNTKKAITDKLNSLETMENYCFFSRGACERVILSLYEMLATDYLEGVLGLQNEKHQVFVSAHSKIEIGYDSKSKLVFLQSTLSDVQLTSKSTEIENECSVIREIAGGASQRINFTQDGIKVVEGNATAPFFRDVLCGRDYPETLSKLCEKVDNSNREYALAQLAAKALVELYTELDAKVKSKRLPETEQQPYKTALGHIFYNEQRHTGLDKDLSPEYQNIAKAATGEGVDVDIDQLKQNLSTMKAKIIGALGNDCCRKALKNKGIKYHMTKALIALSVVMAVSVVGGLFLLWQYHRPKAADKRDWTMTKTQSIFCSSHRDAVSRVRKTMRPLDLPKALAEPAA